MRWEGGESQWSAPTPPLPLMGEATQLGEARGNPELVGTGFQQTLLLPLLPHPDGVCV